jgi:curved DNA-binding protein CbpA
MNGQLSDHPLAELIHEISDARLSGVLRLAHERVKAAVYFDAGQVVAALTNMRAFRLAEMLRHGAALDAARLDEIIKEGMSDEHAGLALVRARLLSPSELKRLQERQSSEVLRALLRWAEGEWSFDPRVRLAADCRVRPNTSQLVVESARMLPSEVVTRRMAGDDETLAPAESAQEKIEAGFQLLPTEAFILSRVYEPMRLSEVVAISGLPEEETRRAAYALALGGLLNRGCWPRALSAELLRQARARPAAATEDDARDSVRQAEAPEASATREPEGDQRGSVEELFALARGATHYDVLGVARSSSPEEVKRVYYSLARRFHPDRFRRDADESMRQQIDTAFAKVAQAYEILKDAGLRAAYDLKLSKQRAPASRPRSSDDAAQAARDEDSTAKHNPAAETSARDSEPDSAQPRHAEEKFQDGVAALERNYLPLARKLLGEAARLMPQQARYRAYFGRALASDKATRRQAEAELQTAIALDAGNASYHAMLAELYLDVGLRRKAEGELERALSLDSKHAPARRLLEELRRAG